MAEALQASPSPRQDDHTAYKIGEHYGASVTITAPIPEAASRMQPKTQARELEPLTIGQLARVLKGLPDKACGPDAVSTQLLKAAPPLSLPSLLQLFQTMEAQAELPMRPSAPQALLQSLDTAERAGPAATTRAAGPSAVSGRCGESRPSGDHARRRPFCSLWTLLTTRAAGPSAVSGHCRPFCSLVSDGVNM